MHKRLLAASAVILAVCMPVSAEQLDKVGPALNYWYNFYFGPDWIRHVEDSINNMRSAQIADSIDLLPPPKMEPGKPWISLDQAPIEFIDGVPHVDALIRYSGNGSDLQSLGVLFRYVQGAKTATVNFPLRQLPYVLALPSIESIPDRTSVNPHNQENFRKTTFSFLWHPR